MESLLLVLIPFCIVIFTGKFVSAYFSSPSVTNYCNFFTFILSSVLFFIYILLISGEFVKSTSIYNPLFQFLFRDGSLLMDSLLLISIMASVLIFFRFIFLKPRSNLPNWMRILSILSTVVIILLTLFLFIMALAMSSSN